ncbi:MAG: glycosyltransferase family 9 protein [Thermoanaerobaculia bacterium]
MNICLIRLSALGDTIHALTLVNGLRHGFPDAKITWILEPLPYEIVRHQPAVDEFIVFNARKGIAAWRELARTLRGRRFDIALLPQVSFKAGLVSLFVRAERKIGFDRARSRELHSLFVGEHIPARPMSHAQDQFLEFLDHLGVHDYPLDRDIAFTEDEVHAARAFFAAINKPVVAFVIATAHEEKNWPPDLYARAVDGVAAMGLQPLLVGGPSERDMKIADAIIAKAAAKPLVALDRPIRHMLLKLRGAAVVVAPDTGPMHAAVAMNRPTVALYGYSDPRRCGPYGRYDDLLINRFPRAGEDLGPITRETRPGSMRLITPEEVLAKIAYAIETYGAKGGV